MQRRRYLVLAVYLLVSVALAWTGSTITLKTDITDLLPEGVASGADLRFYIERFGSTDALFFSVSTPSRAELDENDAIDELEDAAARLSAALNETGLFRSVRYGFSEEEGLQLASRAMEHLPVLLPVERIDDLRRRTTRDAIREALRRLKSSAAGPMMAGPRKILVANDPLGLLSLIPSPAPSTGGPMRIDPGSGLFLSEDGRSLLVIAAPVKPPQDVAFSHRLLAAVEAIEQRVAADSPAVSFDHAGGYLFAVQDEGSIRHDITWTSAISMSAILLLFTLMLRRLGLLLVLMVPLALSTLWTLGVAAIYPGHLNVVTVAFAAILLGMGDDSLTHLYLRFQEEISAGRERAEALRVAMASTGPSIFVATLASGLAFASLTFVRFRGLSELGIIAAIGLLNLLVSVYFLFPCLLSFGNRDGRVNRRAALQVPMGAFVFLYRWGMRHRRGVLAASAALTAAAGFACTKLEFSSDIRSLRGTDPAQERLARVLAPFGGMSDPLNVMREAPTLEEALRSAEALLPACRRLQQEGSITGFVSVASWLPSEATQKTRFERSSTIDWSAVRRDLRAAADELDINESFFAEFLVHLENYPRWAEMRIDSAAAAASGPIGSGLAGTAVATALFPAPGQTPAKILARARQIDATAFAPPTRVASVALVVDDLTAVIEGDFTRASAIALVAVLLTAAAAFRTPGRLMLVGCPVLVGCLLMLGGLAILRVPINLMNLVATPLVFGLGIDFGVYIVNRHDEEGRTDVPKVLHHTGGAILLTGLTTLAGFGSLLSARFAGLRSMGWVAVLGIGGCLMASLLILPLLLPGAERDEA